MLDAAIVPERQATWRPAPAAEIFRPDRMLAQIVDDALQVIIDALDAAQVLLDIQLIGMMRQFPVTEIVPAGQVLDLAPVIASEVAFGRLG